MFFQQEPEADKYLLCVTAGPSYDPSTHVTVPVNKPETVKISSDLANIELNVRIKGYRGLPADSPSDSAYFYRGTHVEDGDQYSICFRFTPLRPADEDPGAYDSESVAGEVQSEDDSEVSIDEAGIRGDDLQFGNDFDKPIRDYLPPGFNTALNIMKWWVDPGLDGDAYCDTPHLFGPALSSFNTIHCGPGTIDPSAGLIFSEGGDEQGMKLRNEAGMPKDAKERMKWALNAGSKEKWRWEYGHTYGFDFFNPYIDFEGFKVQLPGFKLGVLRYWDGQSLRFVSPPLFSHLIAYLFPCYVTDLQLTRHRYVLRNKRTNEVYLVVVFSLYLKEDLDEDSTLRGTEKGATEEVLNGKPKDSPTALDGVDTEHEIFKKDFKLGPDDVD